jgi:HSP20 family protein
MRQGLYDRPSVTDYLHHDAADLAEDARRLLAELDRDVPGAEAAAAECRPAIDVVETAATVEVVVDVAGVPAEALRVAIRRNSVLIVGVKLSGATQPAVRFHLAERSYGRFARVIRLAGAADTSRARATLARGQLRVVLPRLDDRRGRVYAIPVERA